MNTINPHGPSYSRLTTDSTASAPAMPSTSSDKTEMEAMTSARREVADSTVSILARQLSEVATRAGKQSADPLNAITGDTYLANKAQHDVELPDTDNPEHLARARQATGFINGADSNPFKGLARDQLSLIARDDGGTFTINERRAAWEELQSTAPTVATSPKQAPVNGRELMISILFNGTEPPVARPPATSENGAQNAADFLNLEDRAVVADMYAYAQEQGADLTFVTVLAATLGDYRHYSDGRQNGGGNTGYDIEGYRVTFDYKPEGAALAASILNGSAINSTRLDQGFVRYTLNPDHGAFSNVGGIPFLERMVKKFSNEGADQPPLGSEFAKYRKVRYEDHIVKTTHQDIRLPPSKALINNDNGVWTLTELGKAQGYVLDKVTGQLSKPIARADEQPKRSTLDDILRNAPRRYLLDAVAGNRDELATRRIWPGHLFKLIKNYKP
ncbi:hypothetical protein [Pseudomonas nabeulensis]|nr:hypothetical protein [Pseudomonas nabeulensis]